MFKKIKQVFRQESLLEKTLKQLEILSNKPSIANQTEVEKTFFNLFKETSKIKECLDEFMAISQSHFCHPSQDITVLKILTIFHTLISLENSRPIFTKMIISKDSLQVKQGNSFYSCLTLILSSNTSYIFDKNIEQNTLVTIYYTLSNQCHLGLSIVPELKKVLQNKESFPLIETITKLLYQDMHEIYNFLAKDIKTLVENHQKKQDSNRQIYELYKECLNIQNKLIHLYRLDANFQHHKMFMPPKSLLINPRILQLLSNEVEQKEDLKLAGPKNKSFHNTHRAPSTVQIEEKHDTPKTAGRQLMVGKVEKQFQFPHVIAKDDSVRSETSSNHQEEQTEQDKEQKHPNEDKWQEQ